MRNRQLTIALLAAAMAAVLIAAIALLYDPYDSRETPAAPGEGASSEPIVSPAVVSEPPSIANRPPSPAEQRIQAVPEIQGFFSRLKTQLPEDYAYVIDWLDHSEDMTDPDLMLSEAAKILRQRYRSISAQAQGPALDAVFDRQRTILEALQSQNQKSCAAYLFGGVDASFAQSAAENRKALANLALVELDAVINGQKYHILRKPPTEEDFRILEEALAQQGVDAVEIDALLDGKISDPPPEDEKLCAAGVAYLKLLGQLPDDQRQRIYALAIALQGRN